MTFSLHQRFFKYIDNDYHCTKNSSTILTETIPLQQRLFNYLKKDYIYATETTYLSSPKILYFLNETISLNEKYSNYRDKDYILTICVTFYLE